jgi:hypothetical protein
MLRKYINGGNVSTICKNEVIPIIFWHFLLVYARGAQLLRQAGHTERCNVL